MRPQFRVTYEIYTPESSEHGEPEESGFVEPRGWHYALGQESPEGLTLREACELVECLYDAGRWFAESDGRTDYQTAAHETRALHPPCGITPASYARLRRLLCPR